MKPLVAERSRSTEPQEAGSASAIDVKGLTKSYGENVVLQGIDLKIPSGVVYAIVGPNGAGKTTTVEILEGFRSRDGGAVEVLGIDPMKPTHEWRTRIGIVLQSCQMPGELTVGELVERFGGYYPHSRAVSETLDLVGLADRATARAGSLSGGQQRRLDVALALVGDPELIFLDEPTTGFDPSARHNAWEVIGRLRDLGKTIILTTHYMEEAEALADRVAVIVAGDVVAEGPPETLGGRGDATAMIRFRLPPGLAFEALPVLPGCDVRADNGNVVARRASLESIGTLVSWALDQHLELPDLVVERPSLEDVYLELIGGSK